MQRRGELLREFLAKPVGHCGKAENKAVVHACDRAFADKRNVPVEIKGDMRELCGSVRQGVVRRKQPRADEPAEIIHIRYAVKGRCRAVIDTDDAFGFRAEHAGGIRPHEPVRAHFPRIGVLIVQRNTEIFRKN